MLLQAQRHDVVFIVLIPSADPCYTVTARYFEGGVTYIHLSVRRDFDFSPDPELERASLNIFREFGPDIIHVQVFDGVNVRSILRASRVTSAKKIITLHIHSLFCLSGACFDRGQVCRLDSLEECSCENCRSAARREGSPLLKYNRTRRTRCQEIVDLADVIICCSQWQRETIRRLLGRESKTVVIYYGVDESSRHRYKATVTRCELKTAGIAWGRFRAKTVRHGWGKQVNAETIRFRTVPDKEKNKIRQVYGSDFKKLLAIMREPVRRVRKKSPLSVFGYLGSLWEMKGLEVLWDAVHRLEQLKFHVLLGISLEPMSAQNAVLLKKLKADPHIRIMPHIPRAALYEKFFSQIDYLIIPSVWEETGPMTLFEALFYKIPVIVSDHPSMIEKTIPGINSLVFNDAKMLAGIMDDLIAARIAMGMRSRKNFPVETSRRYAASLERVYSGTSRLPATGH